MSTTNEAADAGNGLNMHENDGAASSDPGLSFLREISLTADEEEEYANLASSWIPALIEAEAGTADDGWKSVTTLFGAKVWSKSKPAEERTSLVVCKGQLNLPSGVTLKLVQDQFIKVYNNTPALAQQMRISDPMSRETKILYQVPCPDDQFIRIVWGSFRAAGVAWARDFCFLQHAAPSTDPSTGERLFCVVAGSIERPEVPDMEKLCKRIRSTVKNSGYVFRELADGTLQMTYVVNVNPNGWIPSKIVNAVCINQAMNVSRVHTKLVATANACAALKMESPIKSATAGWRQSHEITIPRPAAGTAASTVSVKFWAQGKVSFRITGVSGGSGAVKNWKPEEAAADIGSGDWVAYASETAVSVEFTIEPEGAPAATVAANGDGSSAGVAEVVVTDVDLQDKEACVLEWKAAGWFKGFTVYHHVASVA